MNLEELKVVDADVAAAIEAEMDRQNSHIELIASENWVSDAVMEAQGSIMTNKYAEGRVRNTDRLYFYYRRSSVCSDGRVCGRYC